MPKKTTLTIDRQFFAILLLQSFRYCLGRMTYAVSDCSEALQRYWSELPYHFQEQIHRDILQAIEKGYAGHDCDIKSWREVLELPLKKDLRIPKGLMGGVAQKEQRSE